MAGGNGRDEARPSPVVAVEKVIGGLLWGSGAMDGIHIKAGKRVYRIIQDGGFHLDHVTTYVGPAVGPRWLIASGFDLTLLQNDVLGRKKPVLLVGSSSGAWRFAAWLQPEPEKSYRALLEAYIALTFKRKDKPATLLQSLSDVVNTYLEEDALPFALAKKKYRLAIITCRARHLVASEIKWVQRLGLGICFVMNALNRSFLYSFAERIVFYNGPKPPSFCLHDDFRGQYIPLSETNFKHVVLASGAIPLVVAGVRDIYGAPRGVYRDGGLTDYHLGHNYTAKDDEITLFFHHQERIIPGWLDKRLTYRQPAADILENVLMVYPSREFILKLPGGKIPDRDDFKIFLDDPAQRKRNWRQVVEQSAPLGEQFLDLVESKKIKHVVEKI
ncbi:MAG: hypothetical protein AUK24_03965 [Syntrophaceae bacterium CG2_30_49_12]|nr:MAG: hypothetical protein AUK24_03965 [Syntrophaceae bacterium CG2_30_49_12]